MDNALLWAIKNGEMENIQKAIESVVDINADISGGRSGLHFASDYGQLEVCEFLVSKGANVDLVDKHGITPLLAAIWEGHSDVCKFLISQGAKKDGLAPNGYTYMESTDLFVCCCSFFRDIDWRAVKRASLLAKSGGRTYLRCV